MDPLPSEPPEKHSNRCIAYPFSGESSQPRNQIGVSCIAGGFFTSSATRGSLLSLQQIGKPDFGLSLVIRLGWKDEWWMDGWKRSWNKRKELPPATQKTGFYPKKVTLCIWWDWKWILNYDLLLENQMITSNMYCSQLDQVKAAFDKKKASRISQQRMHNLPSG